MFNFHYTYILKKKYENDAELFFTDTGSLFYGIFAKSIYEDFWGDKKCFDIREYTKYLKYLDETNQTSIGELKDEGKSKIITEIVDLRSRRIITGLEGIILERRSELHLSHMS